MGLKKLRKIILSATILSIFSLNHSVFADQLITDVVKSSNENSDVNIKTDKDNTDEHIIPVLELKGGVKEVQPEKPSILKSWLEGDYATGNWSGLRTKLEDHGITISGSYFSGDYMNLHGGKKSAVHLNHMGLIDTGVSFDTEKMGLWKGGTLFTHFQGKHGLGLTQDYVGDIQQLESFDSHRFNQLSEYWYEQSLLKDHLKFKVGKQDANVDFCALNSGFNYANSSLSFIPTIPLPSYPDPAMGIVATIKPVNLFSIKSGWFDGEGIGGESGFASLDSRRKSLFINELGVNHSIKNYSGNYFIGHWLHTGHADEYTAASDPRTFGQNYGWYMGAEQLVFKENKDTEDDQGLTLLGHLGWAPADRNELSSYYSLGMQYKGLVPNRNNDLAGFASSNASFSGRLKSLPDDGRYGTESALEMYYKIQLTPWLAVQPDMQVLLHPNGQEKSAFVMGLRTLITF